VRLQELSLLSGAQMLEEIPRREIKERYGFPDSWA
jgi:hypothetical protein